MSWPKALPKPNLFLIGGAKCATTTLAYYLAQQKSVCWSIPKEPWFFCQEDLRDLRQPLTKGWDWYAQCFSHWHGEEWLGDASVSYLYSRVAVQRIMEFNPKAKFLIILRNPMEVAVSLHRQMLYNRQESVVLFERAWELQHLRKQGREIPKKCANPKFLFYFDWCDWATQLARLWSVVDRKQVLVLFFDELIRDPNGVEKKISGFLGMDLLPGLGKAHENRRGDPYAWSVGLDNLLSRLPMHFVQYLRTLLPLDRRIKRPLGREMQVRLAREFVPILKTLSAMLNHRIVDEWLQAAELLLEA